MDGLDTGEDPLELAARLRLVTSRLARRLRRQGGSGLSPSQHSALVSIDLHGPLTLGRLAQVEQVAPPTITKIVGRLEQDTLVARSSGETDRRQTCVQITPKGSRRLEHSRERRNHWLAQQLGTCSPADRRSLAAALPILETLAASQRELRRR
jgi:DNA-binding MarR family transcriptional regulator